MVIDADVFRVRSHRPAAKNGRAVLGARSRMVDFGDVEAMAGLRARVLGILQLVSAASSVLGVFTVPAFRDSGAAPYGIGFDLVVGLWALWRGKRLGDLSFLGLLVLAQAVAGSYLWLVFPAGSVVPAEYGLLCPTIVAAVFCTRRWHLIVQTISVIAITGWLASVRVDGTPALTQTVFGEVFTFTVVAVVVRFSHGRSLPAPRATTI